MNKRDFLKTSLLAGAATQIPFSSMAAAPDTSRDKKIKHWVWVNPNHNDTEAELQTRYQAWYDAGIRGVFFEEDSEKHFRAAQKHKLEAHRWMWTLNRGEKSLLEAHPEWYARNRKGESCADKPPYVGYYRWLCPSRDEVHAYLEQNVRDILSKDYTQGIHLDYVRYCDVILPVNLWSKYGITQNEEKPEYDFCYCDVCRKRFKEQTGHDPLDLEYPDQSPAWRVYRYNQVTRLVNRLAAVAASYKKDISAAVFPTPEIARRIVRQDWTNWNLTMVCPMIYHGFYRENEAWIGEAVGEGLRWLCGKFPLFAGLYMPDFKDQKALAAGVQFALKNGASGVSIFGEVNEGVLKVLKEATA